ncbi:MAG: AI-2E family transporter [Tyzzerella sp.]|uniref:AI-2E family transporter n=1 Tax=Candidatus Fimicola merdigallinarum TaxID=2840819 RepID=A0A9D9H4I6_9FIRM|nr:AI-2E family transporter [Candidatus Fimicola merdigallinarum]
MKLPWDKEYLKISFHVIVTIVTIYVLSILIKNIYKLNDIANEWISFITTILSPLIIALVFSYVVNPIVEFFQDKTESLFENIPFLNKKQQDPRFKVRTRGTIFTYILIFFAIGLVLKILVSKIGSADINMFANMITASVQEFSDLITMIYVKLEEMGVLQNVNGSSAQQWITKGTNAITNYVMGFANSFSKVGSGVLNTFIGLTIAFYLLAEKERILYYCNDAIDVFFNSNISKTIKGVFTDMNNTFSGYIRGQVTDAIIMATLISISFSIAGIKYGIVIGIISGFSNLIPYVGAIVAFILSVGVGLLSGTPIKALYAAIIVLVLQQIDSIFIVPRVVGKSVELHPVLVLLSLSIFGSLFGILGMVVAVPVTALIKIFISRWYIKKREERFS